MGIDRLKVRPWNKVLPVYLRKSLCKLCSRLNGLVQLLLKVTVVMGFLLQTLVPILLEMQ